MAILLELEQLALGADLGRAGWREALEKVRGHGLRELAPGRLVLLTRADAADAEHVEECLTDLDAEVIARVGGVGLPVRSVLAEVLGEGSGHDRDDSRLARAVAGARPLIS